MSDEARAAEMYREDARLIVLTPPTGAAWAAEPGKLIPAAFRVASAYLREHPDDDSLAVDEAWLRAEGFSVRGGDVFAIRGNDVWVHVWGSLDVDRKEVWYVALDNKSPFITGTVTRGAVRRLCAALGIKLNDR